MFNKKISPQAAMALKEALAVIYWKKDDLQDFIKIAIENKSILATIDWSGSKRQAVKELVERMIARLDIYGSDLISLFISVTEFDDYSRLKFWDDDGSKIKKAREAVSNLRTHTKGFIQISRDDEEIRKRKVEAEKRIIRNKSMDSDLSILKERFYSISTNKNFLQRGFDLEKFLYDVFLLFELDPKGAFKIHGEQIDGAFTFQGTDYLLEAKWARQVNRSDIATFCYKVESKFKTAAGLLVSIDGVTPEAISPDFKSIIIMDGQDLACVLEGRVTLPDMLFRKRRKASETGNIYVTFSQL